MRCCQLFQVEIPVHGWPYSVGSRQLVRERSESGCPLFNSGSGAIAGKLRVGRMRLCYNNWMSKLVIGSETEAYCTKCRLVLAHTIISMDGTKPRRVQCNTCSGEHNYRATKPGAKTKTAKKEKTARGTPKKSRQSWEDVMREAADKPHKQYSMSGSFSEGDWIKHNTFGLGCVQTFVAPNKITVRFADSIRMLVCNHS